MKDTHFVAPTLGLEPQLCSVSLSNSFSGNNHAFSKYNSWVGLWQIVELFNFADFDKKAY